jgi:hypothetical protein
MTKLKLGTIDNDRPVKLSIEFAGPVHRTLLAYAEAIGRETGQPAPDPVKLVPLMVERFMASDRAFARVRRPKTRP